MKSVKIGHQEWSSENLNVDHFNNGDLVIHASTNEEWKKAVETGTPAWCYYGHKAENEKKYGKL